MEADACNRAKDCRPEIDFALSLESVTDTVTKALDEGRLPWRVTHNDTKINNVMLDNATGEGICVIDLDTVMPGSSLYDFGDEVRTSVGQFAENERDLSKVFVDLDRFESLVKGHLSVARDYMTDEEIGGLVLSGLLMTFEVGIRFLADHLQGDTYFKIQRDGENLDRCRTQFEFVRCIRKREADMTAIVERYRS
jgi:hypothetical protein